MRRLMLVAVVAFSVACAKTGARQQESVIQKAGATITGAGISGTLDLTEVKVGTGTEVELNLEVAGLKPGMHGVHLHAVGNCDGDFTTAGGHFDPGPSGNPEPDANHPFHMGDVPNLSVGDDGRGSSRARTTRVTLSAGPLTLFDADGTAIIVHGNPDQGATGAPDSGVSGGPRVACGVIARR